MVSPLPSEYGPDGGGRMKSVSITKPVVYGNIARYFGKKREEDGHTHEWTVYLKPFNNEDMSTYIKKVQFKLHESYANQTRVLTRPPYEVTETGWGEFEVGIKIFFHDPNEKPVTIYHILKLFHSSPGNATASILYPPNAPLSSTPPAVPLTPEVGKKVLVAENYEELVFQEPSAMLYQLLQNTPQLTLGEMLHYTDINAKISKTKLKIEAGKKKVADEITDLRDKIQLAKETLVIFKEKYVAAQEEAAAAKT